MIQMFVLLRLLMQPSEKKQTHHMTLLHCFVHLVSHEFGLGIIFVCFVWLPCQSRGQQTFFVLMSSVDVASCSMLRCLQATHICNTSNRCGKWCPFSLFPGRLRYLVQRKLLMGLEKRIAVWNLSSQNTFTLGH